MLMEIELPVLLPNLPENPAGIPHRHHIRGNVLRHYASGPDYGIFPDGNSRQEDRSRADPAIFPNMDRSVKLQILFPQLGIHRMAGGRQDHVGAEKNAVIEVKVDVVEALGAE